MKKMKKIKNSRSMNRSLVAILIIFSHTIANDRPTQVVNRTKHGSLLHAEFTLSKDSKYVVELFKRRTSDEVV
ncbi:MAG: hypothetical protein MHMPM18_005012, partial [Marteilia pararefringens]